MTRPFRPYDPDQLLLLPPSLRDWVPEGDLSNFVSDTIDALDLSGLYAGYRDDGKGEVPYDPRMMVKILVYAYSVGVFSSRRIAKAIERDVAFRVLAAGNFPDHRTINRFRSENLEAFEKLFVEVIRLAREVGLVKLGTVAVDGSKVRANASKRKAMSYGRMREEEQRLKREIRELTRRAKEVDVKEDRQYGKEFRGDELPQELERRESRLKKIQEAKSRLEARQREEDREAGRKEDDDKPEGQRGRPRKRKFGEPDEKKQENFTDPESRIMKTSAEGFQQCYNAQIAVDQEAHLIVAAHVGNNAADNDYLIPMVELVERNLGDQAKEVLADAGYHSEQNFQGLQKRNIKGYIPLGREGDASTRKIGADFKLTKAMVRRLKGKRGKEKYRKRKWIAEPPFGWIKRVLGFRAFSMRGQRKARGEWSLVCLAANLRRLSPRMTWIPA